LLVVYTAIFCYTKNLECADFTVKIKRGWTYVPNTGTMTVNPQWKETLIFPVKDIRNVYRISVRELEGERPLETDGRILLK